MQQKSPGQGPPAAAALCRAKAPAKTRTEGQRSTRNNALPAPHPAPRSHAPRARPALSLRPALKSAPSSASCCPESPRAGTRQRARAGICHVRPDSASLRIRADRGQQFCSPRIFPALRFRKFPFFLAFRTPLQPFPLTRPRVRARGQKKPRRPGAKHGEGKGEGKSVESPPHHRKMNSGATARRNMTRRRGRASRKTRGQNRQKRRTKGGPPLQKTRKNAEGSGSNAAGVRRAELRPVQELFALRITSSDAAMMSASAHHCRPESTSPRMRNPNSAAAAGSRLMSTP